MAVRDSMEETVPRSMGRPGEQDPSGAQLRVLFPRHLCACVRLGWGSVVLGRRPPEGGHRLDDPTVSRRHFALHWDQQRGRHVGSDLGSRNGSRVDGAPLRAADAPIPLADGQVVRTGDVVMVYESGPAVDLADSAEVSREAIPGHAAATVRLRAEVATAARDPSPVLLVGETGTGKEYVAREIHRLSGRSGPMLAVNCAALSRPLVESQLFGHARGAFTGAESAHDGVFRAAEGGTLLLDEVGELPGGLQPKLLRALQEREVHPVGASRPLKVDVRIVSATLRDLAEAAEAAEFRLDLYARLSPWEIRVPPLRERRADLLDWIERLVRAWFAARGTDVTDIPAPRFEAGGVERLLLHDWTDNLRGLDRLVHRACSEGLARPLDVPEPSLSTTGPRRSGAGQAGPRAGPTDRGRAAIPAGVASPSSRPPARAAEAAAAEDDDAAERRRRRPRPPKDEVERVLAAYHGSVRATARHFGRDRRQIYRWLEHYGLRDESIEED